MGLVRGALVVDAVRRTREAVTRAPVLERLPDLDAGAREILLEREEAVISNSSQLTG